MRGAFVILIAIVVIGVILYITDIIFYRKKGGDSSKPTVIDRQPDSESPQGEESNEICCGLHLVCEKTGLSPVSDKIEYYDDEELDRFKGREAEDYSPEETEEFRDVLMTLLPQDVAGWSKSIQLRGINLPLEVRDELLMIVGELRS